MGEERYLNALFLNFLIGGVTKLFKLEKHSMGMKKRVIAVFFVFAVLLSGFVLATNHTNVSEGATRNVNVGDRVDKAYACLKDQIEDKETLSLQEAIFGSWALGSEKKLKDKIEGEKRSGESCWPRSACTIKETAQVSLAYNLISGDEKAITEWLLSKTVISKDLVWYLEIDIANHEASECALKTEGRETKLRVKEDMTLEGNPGSCFEISYGGYWLKINERCLENEFVISCDKDFVSTLVYQRKSGGTVFVSSDTHSGASLGSTTEKVNAQCLTTGTRCDYEGTLWGALALSKIGEDISPYMPYLVVASDENQKYLPSAFLHILTGSEDHYSNLVGRQKQEQYWDVTGSPYNRFYDTSLAMLSLGGIRSGEFESAQEYLLTVQTKEGCWNNNNIRDSAFILYAGWPQSGGGSGGGGGETRLCENAGHFCEESEACYAANGNILREFSCTNFREVCCTERVIEVSCQQKKGIVCGANQVCDGRIESSADGSCCLDGACVNKEVEDLCGIAGGSCESSCLESEEEIDASCQQSGEICCKEKSTPTPDSPDGFSYIWILILGILILLILIAIVFRRKLQMWLHRRKNSGNRPQSPASGGRRAPPGYGMPPQPSLRPLTPRYGPPGQRGPANGGPAPRMTRGVKTQEDEEMEQTMKKLREMSK